mgnify:CR=1 FL=1
MNIKQYCKHFLHWIISFPLPKDKEHLYISALMDKTEECMICENIVNKSKKDIEMDKKIVEKEI